MHLPQFLADEPRGVEGGLDSLSWRTSIPLSVFVSNSKRSCPTQADLVKQMLQRLQEDGSFSRRCQAILHTLDASPTTF